MTALVFNCHYNGLSIIQELGRRGVPVLALDCVRSVGTYSRYTRYFRCPDPQVAEDEFIEYLLRLGPSFSQKPVLFPTNDHWAFAISRHKERLSHYYIPCVADYSIIARIIHKQSLNEWALERGFPVPLSWPSGSAGEIPGNAFPIVAKPEYRRISSNDFAAIRRAAAFDKFRLTILNNQADLAQFLSYNGELLPYLIFQEYVAGLSDCMYTIGVYADRNYSVRAMFTGRKVRGFPPDIGDCVVGQIEAVPEELKILVKDICKSIGYHGIAEFEFKRDANTSQFKLIEINPRSWSWIGITPLCGVSLPWIAYNDLTGTEPIAYIESDLPTGSVKYVKLLDDMINCLYRNHQSGYPEWGMTLFQWWKSLKADRIVCAEFAKDDPGVGIHATISMIGSMLRLLVMSMVRPSGKH